MKNGGNPQDLDVNLPFTGLEFHYVYQVIMGMLVFVIVPGIGLLYGGMARRKSALAMIFQAFTVMAVCSFQWAFWGFSLAFSRTGGPFIGDLSNFGMINVGVSSRQTLVKSVLKWASGHGSTVLGISRHSRYRLRLLRTDVLCLRNHDRCWRIL
jgi:hypothetical protein